MAGRTWEKTASGRFTPAGVANSQRARISKVAGALTSRDKLRLGVTPQHPTGKFSNAQAQKMIKNGDYVKMDVKGKTVTVQVTKANRDDVIKKLTGNETTPNSVRFLTNAGRAADANTTGKAQKEFRGTTKLYRGTADNPKVTTRGASRGKGGTIEPSNIKGVTGGVKGGKGKSK